MTETSVELQAVTAMLRLHGYPALNQARRIARQAVGTPEMNHTERLKIALVIEDSMELGLNLKHASKENRLPYGERGIAEERKKYCHAFLGCLRTKQQNMKIIADPE